VRSFRLNFEVDIEIFDPALTRRVDELIAAHQGSRISPAQLGARPFPVRIRDGAARLMLPYL
jgi:cardiolipin synthase